MHRIYRSYKVILAKSQNLFEMHYWAAHCNSSEIAKSPTNYYSISDEIIKISDELSKISDELSEISDELSKISDELSRISDELSEKSPTI